MSIVRKAGLVLFLLAIISLYVVMPVAQAQVPTKTPIPPAQTEEVPTSLPAPVLQPTAAVEVGSPSQLSLSRPLLGMELLEFADAPSYLYEGSLGGGELYIDAGGDCAAGYTSAPATLGLVLTESLGPIQIGFEDLKAGTPVAILIWEDLPGQWWCNLGFVDANYFEFSTMGEGIYFVWVLTETPTAVAGNMFVWEPF